MKLYSCNFNLMVSGEYFPILLVEISETLKTAWLEFIIKIDENYINLPHFKATIDEFGAGNITEREFATKIEDLSLEIGLQMNPPRAITNIDVQEITEIVNEDENQARYRVIIEKIS